VSVGEGIDFNDDFLADCPLDREASAIDFRSDSFKDYPLPALITFHDIDHPFHPARTSI